MPLPSPIPAPFDLHRETVRPEWIDYNGHMNVAYYVLAFDHATDAAFELLDIGEAYRKRTGLSVFALEAHIVYAAELTVGAPIRVTTQLLGHDAKRLHFFHRMFHAERGTPAASLEVIGLNVDMTTRTAAPFPADALQRLAVAAQAHTALPRPPEVGRVIALKR